MDDFAGTTLAYVDDSYRLIILDNRVYEVLKDTAHVSVSEYADAHGKNRASVKVLCAEGRIEGAYKNSSGGLIPENAPWPKRKPRTTKKTVEEKS